jgi:hypothetical protein
MVSSSPLTVRNSNIILIILWTIATGINLCKAFHIDDTFHLESAQWIAKHPDKPMSGDVVWYNNPEKFHHHNQPALLFYLITIVGGIFGYSEIPLHLLLSVFTFLALYFFRKILQLLASPHPNLLLALFALCPAFLVNQNLMTDIPILSLEMIFFYYLLKAERDRNPSHYLTAGIALGSALLIKYSIIPLFVVMLIAIVLQKRYKHLFALLIPLGMLALWSLFNKLEYGGIHLMERPKNELSFGKIFDQLLVFAGCIGAVAPFTIGFFYGAIRKKFVLYLYFIALSAFIVLGVMVYQGVIPEHESSLALKKLFMVNGGLLIIQLLIRMTRESLYMKRLRQIDATKIILYTGIMAISGFMVLYAPFMATRHILLLLPLVLLVGAPHFERAGKLVRTQALITTAALGILLSISDWQNADFYRKTAKKVEIPDNQVVWSSGHWGWQWYSVLGGMRVYSTDSAKIKVGDYLVHPLDISRQQTNDLLMLDEVKRLWEPANISTFFSGNDFASLYNAQTYKGSWDFSRKPIDTVVIYRVTYIRDKDSAALIRKP